MLEILKKLNKKVRISNWGEVEKKKVVFNRLHLANRISFCGYDNIKVSYGKEIEKSKLLKPLMILCALTGCVRVFKPRSRIRLHRLFTNGRG